MSVETGIDNPALNINDNNELPAKSLEPLRNSSPAVVEEEAHAEDLRCGFGSCKPACLQVFNNPKFLLAWLSWYAFVQG
jgi:organic anion transporter 4A/organic anion transporter 4C